MTKGQAGNRDRFRRLLRQSGFRTWKQANIRRGELIQQGRSVVESDELMALQRLADAWVRYRTHDLDRRSIRRLLAIRRAAITEGMTS